MKTSPDRFLAAALKEAKKAFDCDEVPIGAIIVKDGKIIARGHNECIKNSDASAHAEMVALRKACKKLKNYRLNGCDVYVTLEPCPMCAGALVNARAANIIFGAADEKAGACGSVFNIAQSKKLNHRIKTHRVGGEFEAESVAILRRFFRDKRRKCE
ncbi:MAG: tRNA adenosine(34) deaminase TadA [Elusimicrobiota bacterium]|nr:tRNA adenosine(34) deaminase TadA [Elusimicrobiota bacterium]